MNIGVLASHNGSNLQAMIDAHENGRLDAKIVVVISNNSKSGALERARRHGIQYYHLSSKTHSDINSLDKAICNALEAAAVDVIFLAGYMRKLGVLTLARFKGKILNTHPALLPKFGGKGMYGMNVHKAVIKSGVKESGITIHIVDAEYDTGPVVRQCKVDIYPKDTPELLCERVMNCERKFVVETLQKIASNEIELDIV
jgi:phosphoribosylglycinamide formyltransferase-1